MYLSRRWKLVSIRLTYLLSFSIFRDKLFSVSCLQLSQKCFFLFLIFCIFPIIPLESYLTILANDIPLFDWNDNSEKSPSKPILMRIDQHFSSWILQEDEKFCGNFFLDHSVYVLVNCDEFHLMPTIHINNIMNKKDCNG